MNETKIGNFEATTLIITIIINHIILYLPKSLIGTTGSSTLINIVYISIIAILFVLLVNKLFSKFSGYDILDISNFLGGKILKNIISVLFFVYYILWESVLLRNFANCLQIIYYPLTNIFFIILLFLIGAAITCKLKYNAIFKTNLLVTPIVLISIVLLFIGNYKNFSTSNVFPIMGNGFYTTFFSGLSNFFAFSGLSFLYFLPPNLKKPENFKKISIWAVVLSFIYLMLSVASVLLVFSAEIATGEFMPLYSAVKFIEFGIFFQRLDSIFLLIWIVSFSCYLSIVTKFSGYILKKFTNVSTDRPLIYPLALLILAVSLTFKNNAIATFFEHTVLKYTFFIIVVFIGLGILILANLKKKIKTDKEVNVEK